MEQVSTNKGDNMVEQQAKTIHERLEEKLDALLLIMNGNGKIGLCAKVSILWKSSLFIMAAVIVSFIKAFW